MINLETLTLKQIKLLENKLDEILQEIDQIDLERKELTKERNELKDQIDLFEAAESNGYSSDLFEELNITNIGDFL
jgi:chorismate mutase